MSGKVEKFLMDNVSPRTLMAIGRTASKIESTFGVSEADVLRAVHVPEARKGGRCVFLDADERVSSVVAGLPVPPRELRWGDPDEASGAAFHELGVEVPPGPDGGYIASGLTTAKALRGLLAKHGADPAKLGNILDWGCSSGRVIRHFAAEAERAECWGADVGAPYIQWAQEHLSPPFRFVTSTALPHLPFGDATFGFVYGISVMTHLDYLRDGWLVELRRIVKPGGFVLLTVMDEHTAEHIRGYARRPPWLPEKFDLDDIGRHDQTIVRGPDWSWTFTFFRSSYIRRAWGKFFEVVALEPSFEHNQTGVLLRRTA